MSFQAGVERLFEKFNEELKGLAPDLPEISFKSKIGEVKEFRAAYDAADKTGTLSPRVRELVVKMGLMSGKSLFTLPEGQSPRIELSTQKEAIDWVDANKETFIQAAKKYTDKIQNFPLDDVDIHQEARLVAMEALEIHQKEAGSNFLRIFTSKWSKHIFFNYIKAYDSDIEGIQVIDPHGDPELVQKIVAVAADEGRNSDFHPVIAGSANDANLDGTGGASTVLASMTLEEKAAAVRFCDCCEDFDAGGYDVSSAMMKRLAEIGLVKHRGGGWYEGTASLSSIEDDLRAELALINKEFLVNTNPNIRFRASDVGQSYKKMIDIYGGIDSLQEDNSSLNPFIRIQDDSCPAALPKVPSDFTSSLPQPDSPEAIEQIKKSVKEFRVAWQPASGKKPSLAQTYQMVAKALGFKTWEAMVAVSGRSVTVGKDSPPAIPAPNNVVDSSAQPDSLTSEKLTVNDFLKALEKEPYLIDFGIRCSQHIDRNKSKEENLASFQALRESFSNSGFKEFAVCCEWLSGCTKRKTINMSYSSYGLKHMVEARMKRLGREDYYVSNGAFIAAAIHMGFDWKPDFDSPNVRFNISKKSPAILELKN